MGNTDMSKVIDAACKPPMTSNQLKILGIIKQNFDVEKVGDITEDTVFETISIDSITFIKMVVMLEDSLDFEFDDEKLMIAKFSTVKSLIQYIESKIN